MFIDPATPVYAGQIVGMANKGDDLTVNVCKKKHMTALRLVPPIKFSLEQSLEFIADDELVEVTPKNIRLRKKILDHAERMRITMRNRAAAK